MANGELNDVDYFSVNRLLCVLVCFLIGDIKKHLDV